MRTNDTRTSALRRFATRAGVVAGAAVLAVAGLGVSAASAHTPTSIASVQETKSSLAGVWQVEGVADGNPVAPVFTFNTDGTLSMDPEDHAYVGTGTWSQYGNSFSFHLEHPIFVDGVETFHISADQAGTIDGDHWASSGHSVQTDMQGNVVAEFEVTIEGTRIG